MKRYNLIAAVNRSGVIGVDGKIPWKFKADMAHFKRTTSCGSPHQHIFDDVDLGVGYSKGYPHFSKTPYKAVIMGYKTWSSLSPNRALPHRHNIVLSKGDWDLEEVEVVNSIDAACKAAADYDEVWVIGGASIYSAFLEADLIERMLITEVPTEYPYYGTKFPGWHDSFTQREDGNFILYMEETGPKEWPRIIGWKLHNTKINNGLIVHDFRRIDDA